ncbi:hypothetical protein M5C99_04390 [Acidovorax sp. NCPPB 2350]|nr:hypothetical protein M5C99_04390 [Acidovorax sp. NCPPB 2350]
MFQRIRAWLRAAPGETTPSTAPQSEAIGRLREARIANQLAEAALRKASAEKERRQALESHSKRLTGYIDTAKTAIPLIAAGYGVLATFLYCFVVIKFFPSGLSVGDNLLFVFVALGFGLLTFLLLVLGCAAFVPLMTLMDAAKKNPATETRQVHLGFWIVALPLIKISSILALWTLYDELPSPSNAAAGLLINGHAATAAVLGGFIAWRAWKNGTTASSREGFEWIFLGCCYGIIELCLLPWIAVLFPQYAGHILVLPWIAGLPAWMVISSWMDAPSLRRLDANIEKKDLLNSFAIGLVILAAVLMGVVAMMEWPFERRPATCLAITTFLALVALMALLVAIFLQSRHRPATCASPDRQPPERQVRPEDDQPRPATSEPTELPTIQSAYALESRIYFSLLFLLAIYGTALYVDFQIQGKLSSGIFRSLGLRAEQQTMRLKGDALALVRTQARNAGVPLSFCAEPGGAALVAPVDALWHGMGTRSLLRIGTAPEDAKDADRSTAIEVNSDEVKIVRNAQARCHDIGHSVYFRSNSTAPVNGTQPLADEIEHVLKDMYPVPPAAGGSPRPHWRLDKVIVTGHSDPMPLSDAGNQSLSQSRAECVADWLSGKPLRGTQLQGTYRLDASGEGGRDPSITQCPHEGRADNLRECHERNRRVTVRLIFTRKPPLSSEEQHALFRQGERASAEGERQEPACAAPGRPSRS